VAVAAAFEGAFGQVRGPGGGSDEWHSGFRAREGSGFRALRRAASCLKKRRLQAGFGGISGGCGARFSGLSQF